MSPSVGRQLLTLQDGCWSVMLAQRLRKVPDQSMEHPIQRIHEVFRCGRLVFLVLAANFAFLS